MLSNEELVFSVCIITYLMKFFFFKNIKKPNFLKKNQSINNSNLYHMINMISMHMVSTIVENIEENLKFKYLDLIFYNYLDSFSDYLLFKFYKI